MFANEPYDAELDNARAQNDLVLKNCFEAIFAKYSQDFTTIGDEIDISTGNIVVNNGHLARMESETDTGMSMARSATPKDGTTVANGRSMLRAMTVAPGRDDSYFEDEGADDVIASIETIAGVITISSDEEEEEEEDDDEDFIEIAGKEARKPGPSISRYQDAEKSRQSFETKRNDLSDTDSLCEVKQEQRHSSPDSLFEVKQEYRHSSPDSLFEFKQDDRESSPDSLFEVKQESRDSTRDSSFAGETPPTSVGMDRTEEEQAILDKFGENVGREVLDFIANRDRAELHIEPAWRIPVHIDNQQSSSLPPVAGSSERQSEPADQMGVTVATEQLTVRRVTSRANPSPNKGKSLWARPAHRGRKKLRREGLWKRVVREESEDPLQDGFNSDSDESLDFQEDPDEEADLDRCWRIMERGICPWCRDAFDDRAKVHDHLRRAVRREKDGKPPAIGHNMEHIIKVRANLNSKSRARGKGSRSFRLLVGDLKSLVELHEAGGYPFEYIIEEKLLRTTRRNAGTLKRMYQKYRRMEDDEDDSDDDDGETNIRPWIKQEEDLITKLSSKPMTTMDTIRRKLKCRTNREIGTYLAKKWLEGCLHEGDPTPRDTKANHINDEDKESDDELFPRTSFPATTQNYFIREDPEDEDEDSEDDIYLNRFLDRSLLASAPKPASNQPEIEQSGANEAEDSADDLFVGPSFPVTASNIIIKQEELEDGAEDDLFVPNIW